LLIFSEAADQKVQKVEPGTATEDHVRAEYQRRHDKRREARERWSWLEQQVADARLVVFSAGLMLAFFVYRMHWPNALWLIIPLLVFVALVVVHEPLRRRSGRAGRAMDFYAKGLARMEDRWAGTGVSGLGFLDLNHPYAADLDLFGAGSLFERLCTARTRAGEDALASWLLAPAPLETLFERHEAVTELRPRLDLREDLELLGSDVRSAIDPEALSTWGKAPRAFPGRGLRITAAILASFGSAAVIGWAFFELGVIPLLLTLAIEIAFAFWLAEPVRRVLTAVDERAHDLILLGDLLDRLEREPSRSELLRRLSASLETQGRPASVQIRRLARLVHLLDARKNQFFAPFAALLLWKTQLAMVVDAWRGAEGPAIAGWLRAVGEFEALCALAAYSAENPADPFPEILSSGARFEAEGMGHPLIPAAECVRNDLSLGGSVRALVVSGSNMSGKSTLLRTAGVATVMALAGAPVRAVRLRVSPLAVGATLRVQDSLQAGKSRFYAEITRVRQLVDLAGGPLPLFFLFDELFHGTNSHDRRIGAESVLRGLLDRGAIGLITTHDLALAKIATGIGPQAVNVHFADHFEDGQMRFDYRMRPGVVEHSNALALMRAVGLDV
jgi:MutS domain V